MAAAFPFTRFFHIADWFRIALFGFSAFRFLRGRKLILTNDAFQARDYQSACDGCRPMGDKSPKATNKKAAQKQANTNSNTQKKSSAAAAKQAVKPKKYTTTNRSFAGLHLCQECMILKPEEAPGPASSAVRFENVGG